MEIRGLYSHEIVLASELADGIYPASLYEPPSSFASKFAAFPSGVLGAFDPRMVGYVFSHPWIKSRAVNLAAETFDLPAEPDCYYIHDLRPDARGKDVGKMLALSALDHGRSCGFNDFRLVAVNGTEGFWSGFGFRPLERFRYGENDACKMGLRIGKVWEGTSTSVVLCHLRMKVRLSEFRAAYGDPVLYDGYVDYGSC